jgi:hypothetical protein
LFWPFWPSWPSWPRRRRPPASTREEKAALAAACADEGEFDRVGLDWKSAPSDPEGREGVTWTEIDGAPHVAATDVSFLS